jgi:hypothetical protein
MALNPELKEWRVPARILNAMQLGRVHVRQMTPAKIIPARSKKTANLRSVEIRVT